MRSKVAERIASKTTESTKQKVREYADNIIRNRLEILEQNYLEHFKYAKDLALVLPLNHPKRKEIDEEMNVMTCEINKLKKGLKC